MGKLIGYARVLTRAQDADRQITDLLGAGVRRLPTATAFSKATLVEDWAIMEAESRGATIDRQFHVQNALWHRGNQTEQFRLVTVCAA